MRWLKYFSPQVHFSVLIVFLLSVQEAHAVLRYYYPIANSSCKMSQLDSASGTWTKVKTNPPESVDVEKTWRDSFGDEISQFSLDGKTYSIESRCLQVPGLTPDFRAKIPLARIRSAYLVFLGGYQRYPLTLSSQTPSSPVSNLTYSGHVGIGRDWILLPFLFTRLIGTVNVGAGKVSELGTTSLEAGTRLRAGLGWLLWSHGMLAFEGGGYASARRFTVQGGYSLLKNAGLTYNGALDVGWSASRFIRLEAGFLSDIKEPFYTFGVGFGL
jgi:hypothetical protein